MNHLALNLQIMDVFNSHKKYVYYIHLYFYVIVTVFIAWILESKNLYFQILNKKF